jgi:hypothetical protein
MTIKVKIMDLDRNPKPIMPKSLPMTDGCRIKEYGPHVTSLFVPPNCGQGLPSPMMTRYVYERHIIIAPAVERMIKHKMLYGNAI